MRDPVTAEAVGFGPVFLLKLPRSSHAAESERMGVRGWRRRPCREVCEPEGSFRIADCELQQSAPATPPLLIQKGSSAERR